MELIFIIDKRMLIPTHHHCHATSNENKIYQSKYEAQATAKLTLSNSGIKLVISNVQTNT
jgi:hypothetical protein